MWRMPDRFLGWRFHERMEIQGWLPLILAGLLGAGLHEGLKVFAAFREGKPPARLDWVGSAILVVLGALVPLVYGLGPKPFLEVAQLAVGIPALISGGFRVTTASSGLRGVDAKRSTADYLGWRL